MNFEDREPEEDTNSTKDELQYDQQLATCLELGLKMWKRT